MAMVDSTELQDRIRQIEKLVQEVESSADPALRATAKELLQCLMDLHGAGLERMLEIVHETEAGQTIIDSLGTDPLVSSLLVLYNLHPDPFDKRVERGLTKVAESSKTHGAGIELLSIEEGVVRVAIRSNGHGCGSRGRDMEALIREALYESAPDAAEVVIEEGSGVEGASGFVPLASLQAAAPVTKS